MSKTLLFLIALSLLMPIATRAQGRERKPLDIYYIDTEGGKSALFVSPTGETLLYDTGTGGDSNRDLDRILAVMKAANLPIQQLDHVIVSTEQEFRKSHPVDTAPVSHRNACLAAR